jgi:hypothetical protein
MIQLPETPLPKDVLDKLRKLQQQVDKEGAYAARSALAKSLWGQKNKADNPIFKVVRAKLTEMCQGAKRCAYCEDAPADEVEHIRPKDIFPSHCFKWENYLYACGPCNGPKSNKYAVFVEKKDGELFEIPKDWAKNNGEEPNGTSGLIDPRTENPLEFLLLDIQLNTFIFAPLADSDEEPRKRNKAKFTIDTLRLNEREYLVKARKNAFHALKSLLENYISKRIIGTGNPELVDIERTIKTYSHQTVWQEMKRQRDFIPALKKLFDAAPEALAW